MNDLKHGNNFQETNTNQNNKHRILLKMYL